MFEEATRAEPRNVIGEWALRGGIALLFLLFGWDKFSSDPNSQWVKMFQQIGIGQWFRYFTGVVEVLGAALVLIPRTTLAGVALLACAMLGAALIWIFVLGHPGNSIFCGAILAALLSYGWNHRSGS